jgi:RNA polymerase sigma factor (TIGR02999 family)
MQQKSMRQTGEITPSLNRTGEGNGRAIDELLPLVYEELRALAACHLRGERPNHTLSPTALVHEAYLRLAGAPGTRWVSRAHFFAIAATVIRRVLLKHGRKRRCAKRGGGWRRVDLREDDLAFEVDGVDLVALDEALARLGRIAPQKLRVVELRFFAGLGVDETAEVLSVSPRTVARDWRFARAWLRFALERSADGA